MPGISERLEGLSNRVKNVHNFDVLKIPDLSSKVIIVTGGNNGVGKATAQELAKHNPKKLYLSARSQDKFDGAAKDIHANAPDAKLEYLELDLASLESVKKASEKILAENDRLDILINNAGIMGHPPAVTKEGYEIHFGTNHMGPALLTRLLQPLLEKTASESGADVRVINVSSAAHMSAPTQGISFETRKSDGGSAHSYINYGESKLANVLHAKALSEKLPSVTSVAIHPGRVDTGILSSYFQKGGVTATFQKVYDRLVGIMTPEEGALTSLWAATAPKDQVVSGEFYKPVGAHDPNLRELKDLPQKLWDYQETEFTKLGY